VPFTLGIRLKMEPHWHTYWKFPGDSGLPTRMRWALPEGWSAAPFEWPYPQAIPAAPLMSYGYEGEVTLLVSVTPPKDLSPGSTATVGGRLDWLECKDVCLPGKAPLDVQLPVRAGRLCPWRSTRPSSQPRATGCPRTARPGSRACCSGAHRLRSCSSRP
jgi:thiol:disulfide interchange protein DsbD